MADPVTIFTNIAIAAATSAISSALAPKQKFEGPRLDDLRVQTSTYGKFRPIPFGTIAYAGNVFWLENNELKETRHKESTGKGGPKTETTTYTYSATFAVGFGEGPISGFLRLWADSVLIYDSSSTDPATVYESGELFHAVSFYAGTEDQEVHGRIEADDAESPAYRGESYIVFEDFQLEKFGERIPNITAEVVAVTQTATAGGRIAENTDPGLDFNGYYPDRFSDGVASYINAQTNSGRVKTDINGDILAQYSGSSPTDLYTLGAAGMLNGGHYKVASVAELTNPAKLWWSANPSGENYIDILAANGIVGGLLAAVPSVNDDALLLIMTADDDYTELFHGGEIDATRWFLLGASSGGFAVSDSGATQSISTSYYNIGYSRSGRLNPGTSGRSCCLESDYQNFWSVWGAGNGNVTRYTINSDNVLTEEQDIVNGLAEHSAQKTTCIADQGVMQATSGTYTAVFSRHDVLVNKKAALPDVIDSLCNRAGLLSADIVTTSLSSDEVPGFVISSLSEMRTSIEPLQIAYQFDVLESEYNLKFIKRGGASVVTLTEDDLAAHEFGQERGDELPVVRGKESVLPRETKITYISSARDYEPGTQTASRLVTESEQVNEINLPIVLSDDTAAQVAEIAQTVVWIERNTYPEFSLPYKYSYLEPSDVITVNLRGVTHKIRITQTDLGNPGILKCAGVAEKASHYTSTATGIAGQSSNQTLGLSGPTNLVLLDIPILRDQDNDSGFYAAAGGYYSGWPGGVLMKSVDGGQSYTQVASLVNETTIGYLTATPTTGDYTVIDTENTINVKLYNSNTLSSVTEIAMLNGANAAAIGVDGRWVIIKFQTATLEGDGSYTLSNIIWGYKGTEYNLSSLASGDTFVLLSQSSMIRTAANDDEIGSERHYKAVTFGKNIATASEIAFTNNAESLEPYAPTHIVGVRDGSSNLTVTWHRRTRLGGEWRDLVGASLSEDSEAYEIDFTVGGTIVTKTGITSETYSYTAAAQTTDFGSPQSSIITNIYQVSATTGRGHAGTETL